MRGGIVLVLLLVAGCAEQPYIENLGAPSPATYTPAARPHQWAFRGLDPAPFTSGYRSRPTQTALHSDLPRHDLHELRERWKRQACQWREG